MRTLSLTLVVFVGLAVIGLLYEYAAEHRRAQLRARHQRELELERIKTPPPFGSSARQHGGR
ncbi:MAG: hypothetical protein KGL59_01520 [Acidobacteriota bacterium]|nr:hypothetical protein [Acidobacteriota bacterium]